MEQELVIRYSAVGLVSNVSRRSAASLQEEGLSLLLPNAAIAGSRAQSFTTVLTLPPKRLRCGFVSRLTLSLSTANAADVSSSPTETSSLFMPQGTCCKTRQ